MTPAGSVAVPWSVQVVCHPSTSFGQLGGMPC
jgi:hypothetical protein